MTRLQAIQPDSILVVGCGEPFVEAGSQLVGVGLAIFALLALDGACPDGHPGRRRSDQTGQPDDLPPSHHSVL